MINPKQDRHCIPAIRRQRSVAGVVLAIMFVWAVLATPPARAQSWLDNFESYPLGGFPSPNWLPSGNNGTTIVNSTYVSATQSAQLFGVVGGCWSALIHRQLLVAPPFTIQFSARNGNETVYGCHPVRASAGLQTGPSWTYSSRLLETFGANGDFLVNWPSVTTGPHFPPLTWVKVQITYERPDATHVRVRYWLNGQFYRTVTTSANSYEGQLAWLSLASNEGTSWFDDVSVTSGLPKLTKTILLSSPNPSNSGQLVTFTAMVSSPSGPPPNGELVYFMKGKKVLGSGRLSGGVATYSTSTLPVGTTTIKAVYLSDSNFPSNGFAGSNSNPVTQLVQ